MKPHPYTKTIIGGSSGSGKTKKLIEMLVDTVRTYEDKKVLLVVREESVVSITERMISMGIPKSVIDRIEIIEYEYGAKTPTAWQEGKKELIERFIYERNFDVVAFDDNSALMNELIEFDTLNEISREYFTTVQHQRIPQPQSADYGRERLFIPDYSLGA